MVKFILLGSVSTSPQLTLPYQKHKPSEDCHFWNQLVYWLADIKLDLRNDNIIFFQYQIQSSLIEWGHSGTNWLHLLWNAVLNVHI